MERILTIKELADEVLRLNEKCKSSVKNGDIAGHMRIAGEFRCHAPKLARMVKIMSEVLEEISFNHGDAEYEAKKAECQKIMEEQ